MTSTLAPSISSKKLPHVQSSGFRLTGRWLWLGRLAWAAVFTLCVIAWLAGSYQWYADQSAPCSDPVHADWPIEVCGPYHQAIADLHLTDNLFGVYTASLYLLAGVPYFVLSFILARRRPDSARVLLMAIFLAAVGSMGKWMNTLPLWAAVFDRGTTLDLLWPANFILFLWAGLGPALLCAFPDGVFVPRWTRWFLLIWLPMIAANYFLPSTPLNYANLPAPLPQIITLTVVGVVLYSLLYRYIRVASPVQRQQIKWFLAGLALLILNYVVDYLVFNLYPSLNDGNYLIGAGRPSVLWELIQGTAWATAEFLWAICIAFSVFRYRLWDIDILLNRALVYGTLTALVVLIYVVCVGVLGALLQSGGNFLISILSTGLVAVLVQPLRERLQRGINRLMYGERDDPVTVLSRLGQRLEATLAPNAVLPSLVETVAQALKLPYVAIEASSLHTVPALKAEWRLANQHLNPDQYTLVNFPLIYQGEAVGQLSVAPRAPGEDFSPLDRHLLENIAHQAGVAIHAVSLTTELQQARQRLVTIVEEERRRLRRDLHDGLGPALASQGLKLAAAKQLLASDTAASEALLDKVLSQNEETVRDVRRLIYGLRPPALDERGLAEAIRDHVAQTGSVEGLQVGVSELPAAILPLPAAVEVAAYRIALEALTNIIRHARARHCLIQFSTQPKESGNALQIEISDDGLGLPQHLRAGVGLRSMRERAEELGGRLSVEPNPGGGTRCIANLPLPN
jgi:signal transduction histidine kinase